MTQEEKQLLLNDLCGRLPYGVKFTLSGDNIYTMKGIDLIVTDEGDWEYAITSKGTAPIEIMYVKPYLRPPSSMTEEEKEEFINFNGTVGCYIKTVDFCNKHHLDNRGLISMGLALEAPKDMYKNE